MFYIYRITNLINGKTYIGQHKYKKLDDSYMGSGKILKQAIKKHGVENFKKDILVFGITRKDFINLLEKEYIKFYRSIGKAEYNIADGGQGNLGEEVNKKISEANKGKPAWNKGVPMSEEAKKKLSEINKGRLSPMSNKHHTDESKKKMSDSHKGQVAWNKGKKGIQVAWNKDKKMSEEYKIKLSVAHKGQVAWNKGKSMSEEQKKKMEEVREAYKKSGRKDWNTFQKEYKEMTLSK